jgi:hypothetical protein
VKSKSQKTVEASIKHPSLPRKHPNPTNLPKPTRNLGQPSKKKHPQTQNPRETPKTRADGSRNKKQTLNTEEKPELQGKKKEKRKRKKLQWRWRHAHRSGAESVGEAIKEARAL